MHHHHLELEEADEEWEGGGTDIHVPEERERSAGCRVWLDQVIHPANQTLEASLSMR